MIRNLMATTALAVLLSTAAHAQEAAPAPAAPAPATQDVAPMTQDGAAVARSDGHLASAMIGETVYNGTGDDAENIGEVNDLVLNAEGNLDFVVIGVGGFLGLGEKDIAVSYSDLQWVERDGDRWLVAPYTKDQLTAQTEFDRRPYQMTPATTAAAPAPATTDTMAAAPATDGTTAAPAPATTDNMATAPAADGTTAAPAPGTTDTMAQAPATDTTQTAAIDRSTLTEMPAGTIRAEELVGTTVYGANEANVGSIGDVILTQDGQAEAVIIDVGGFLGLGAKEVAVGMDQLAFMADANGNKYLYTTFTKEQLEAQTAYDASTWADQRDQQMLRMQ